MCNEYGAQKRIRFSPGNIFDYKVIENLIEDISGTITFDAGYLVKEEIFKKIYNSKRRFIIATRKNMKRVMIKNHMHQFRARSRIETIWGYERAILAPLQPFQNFKWII